MAALSHPCPAQVSQTPPSPARASAPKLAKKTRRAHCATCCPSFPVAPASVQMTLKRQLVRRQGWNQCREAMPLSEENSLACSSPKAGSCRDDPRQPARGCLPDGTAPLSLESTSRSRPKDAALCPPPCMSCRCHEYTGHAGMHLLSVTQSIFAALALNSLKRTWCLL